MIELILVGKIVKTHGVNGELLLKLEPGKAPANTKEPVFLEFDGIQVPFFIHSSRNTTPVDWYVIFDDYQSLSLAEKLLGRAVSIPGTNLAAISDADPTEELIGYKVRDINFGYVGILKFIQQGMQDLMIIENDGREILVPFVEDFIMEIDDEDKQIVIETPDGLLDMNR
ncbi:MAG: 16S rRNA processing protein RimM [Bacteroidetes bacterium HGW-Bacteroidetes-6]|jgi:16S rRNA processing protein RimM|nr:MAG: 16S rRNA processing protein RimM [Bacteroidetes bacterium HGW-Bacteroidetes-6]